MNRFLKLLIFFCTLNCNFCFAQTKASNKFKDRSFSDHLDQLVPQLLNETNTPGTARPVFLTYKAMA
jgi:organic radical activating enzyme